MSTNVPLSSLFNNEEVILFHEFIYGLGKKQKKDWLSNEIQIHFQKFCSRNERYNSIKGQNGLKIFFSKTQEILLNDNFTIVVHRPHVGNCLFYRFNNGDDYANLLTTDEFLNHREKITGTSYTPSEKKLIIDFKTFQNSGPLIRDYRKIGNGQMILNSHMAGKLQADPDRWHSYFLDFLKIYTIDHEQVMVDGKVIKDYHQLYDALQKAIHHLEELPPKDSIKEAGGFLKGLGFRDGFGSSIGQTLETMRMLADLIEVPNPDHLEQFIAKVPMISKVAIVSPHGWFGQANVLGRPDTGGQIVYILDQVRALESSLAASLKASGLLVTPKIVVLTRLIPENEGTTSNQRLEKIHGTSDCWILRVPFKNKDLQIVPQWISRFEIWPYLEDFAIDAKQELIAELGGKPNLIIGNYSDGNLVASLLSSWLGVVQCNIAHALEKSKYPHSALHWQDMEDEYHFSLQYIADLIAMNQADLIVSSTAQEICGTDISIGQYESYNFFSMPQLFSVVNGINVFHPKFNVVSPGADPSIYFSYDNLKNRLKSRVDEMTYLLFEKRSPDIRGHLSHPEKKPLFTMARLDRIKNITGLVESYGQNQLLQEKSNLIVIAGTIDPDKAKGLEEVKEVERMHELIDQYKLQDKVRWLGMHVPKADAGEMYRIIADRRGVFVQPAWFEAFGLTVIEAMASGLPVFATRFGGPSEIIKDGKNGFLINTNHSGLLTKPILDFLLELENKPHYWGKISQQALRRVKESYNWKLYAEKLLKFAKLYGFWNYSALADDKKRIDQYCSLLFHLIFKKRVEKCLKEKK